MFDKTINPYVDQDRLANDIVSSQGKVIDRPTTSEIMRKTTNNTTFDNSHISLHYFLTEPEMKNVNDLSYSKYSSSAIFNFNAHYTTLSCTCNIYNDIPLVKLCRIFSVISIKLWQVKQNILVSNLQMQTKKKKYDDNI